MAGPSAVQSVESGDLRAYRIVYSLWRCDACGATFAAMDGCKACGATGPQEDPNVEERRSLVEELRGRSFASPVATPIGLGEIWGALSEWVERLYVGLSEVGERGRSGAESLVSALDDLALMRRRASATPRLRPFIAVWSTVDAILQRLAELAAANLDALEAPSPVTGREAEQRAQAVLDLAAEDAAEVARLAAELGTPARDSFFDSYVDRTATVFGMEGAASLTEFDQRGALLFERITRGAVYQPGIGVGLVHVDHLARDFLDAERFITDGRRGYEVFSKNATHLTRLAGDEAWMTSLQRAKRELFGALVDLHDSAQGSVQNEFFSTRAMLRLGLHLTEGVAPHYLATLLALHRRGDWRRTVRYDPAALVHQMEQAGLGALTAGIDPAVRDADAHRDYDVQADRIRLASTRGGREVNPDELVDLVLTCLETCLLLDCGLACALVTAGVSIESLDAASALIDARDRVKMLVAAAGLADVDVAVEGQAVIVKGRALTREWSSLPLAAAIEALAPGDFAHLRFVLASDGASHVDAGPLAPLRHFYSATGFDKETWTVEAIARWRVNGTSLMPRKLVRCWASRRVGKLIEENMPSVPEAAAAIRRLGERLNDQRCAAAFGAMERLALARIQGLPPAHGDGWAAEQIARWLNDCGEPTAVVAASA